MKKQFQKFLALVISFNIIFLSIPIVPLNIHIPIISTPVAYGCDPISLPGDGNPDTPTATPKEAAQQAVEDGETLLENPEVSGGDPFGVLGGTSSISTSEVAAQRQAMENRITKINTEFIPEIDRIQTTLGLALPEIERQKNLEITVRDQTNSQIKTILAQPTLTDPQIGTAVPARITTNSQTISSQTSLKSNEQTQLSQVNTTLGQKTQERDAKVEEKNACSEIVCNGTTTCSQAEIDSLNAQIAALNAEITNLNNQSATLQTSVNNRTIAIDSLTSQNTQLTGLNASRITSNEKIAADSFVIGQGQVTSSQLVSKRADFVEEAAELGRLLASDNPIEDSAINFGTGRLIFFFATQSEIQLIGVQVRDSSESTGFRTVAIFAVGSYTVANNADGVPVSVTATPNIEAPDIWTSLRFNFYTDPLRDNLTWERRASGGFKAIESYQFRENEWRRTYQSIIDASNDFPVQDTNQIYDEATGALLKKTVSRLGTVGPGLKTIVYTTNFDPPSTSVKVTQLGANCSGMLCSGTLVEFQIGTATVSSTPNPLTPDGVINSIQGTATDGQPFGVRLNNGVIEYWNQSIVTDAAKDFLAGFLDLSGIWWLTPQEVKSRISVVSTSGTDNSSVTLGFMGRNFIVNMNAYQRSSATFDPGTAAQNKARLAAIRHLMRKEVDLSRISLIDVPGPFNGVVKIREQSAIGGTDITHTYYVEFSGSEIIAVRALGADYDLAGAGPIVHVHFCDAPCREIAITGYLPMEPEPYELFDVHAIARGVEKIAVNFGALTEVSLNLKHYEEFYGGSPDGAVNNYTYELEGSGTIYGLQLFWRGNYLPVIGGYREVTLQFQYGNTPLNRAKDALASLLNLTVAQRAAIQDGSVVATTGGGIIGTNVTVFLYGNGYTFNDRTTTTIPLDKTIAAINAIKERINRHFENETAPEWDFPLETLHFNMDQIVAVSGQTGLYDVYLTETRTGKNSIIHHYQSYVNPNNPAGGMAEKIGITYRLMSVDFNGNPIVFETPGNVTAGIDEAEYDAQVTTAAMDDLLQKGEIIASSSTQLKVVAYTLKSYGQSWDGNEWLNYVIQLENQIDKTIYEYAVQHHNFTGYTATYQDTILPYIPRKTFNFLDGQVVIAEPKPGASSSHWVALIQVRDSNTVSGFRTVKRFNVDAPSNLNASPLTLNLYGEQEWETIAFHVNADVPPDPAKDYYELKRDVSGFQEIDAFRFVKLLGNYQESRFEKRIESASTVIQKSAYILGVPTHIYRYAGGRTLVHDLLNDRVSILENNTEIFGTMATQIVKEIDGVNFPAQFEIVSRMSGVTAEGELFEIRVGSIIEIFTENDLAAEAAVQDLQNRLGLGSGQVTVISKDDATEWNSCAGWPLEHKDCSGEIGGRSYKVVLAYGGNEGNENEYEYHTYIDSNLEFHSALDPARAAAIEGLLHLSRRYGVAVSNLKIMSIDPPEFGGTDAVSTDYWYRYPIRFQNIANSHEWAYTVKQTINKSAGEVGHVMWGALVHYDAPEGDPPQRTILDKIYIRHFGGNRELDVRITIPQRVEPPVDIAAVDWAFNQVSGSTGEYQLTSADHELEIRGYAEEASTDCTNCQKISFFLAGQNWIYAFDDITREDAEHSSYNNFRFVSVTNDWAGNAKIALAKELGLDFDTMNSMEVANVQLTRTNGVVTGKAVTLRFYGKPYPYVFNVPNSVVSADGIPLYSATPDAITAKVIARLNDWQRRAEKYWRTAPLGEMVVEIDAVNSEIHLRETGLSDGASLIHRYDLNALNLKGLTYRDSGGVDTVIIFESSTPVEVDSHAIMAAVKDLLSRNIHPSIYILRNYTERLGEDIMGSFHYLSNFKLDTGLLYEYQALHRSVDDIPYRLTLVEGISPDAQPSIDAAKDFLIESLNLDESTHQRDIDAIQNITFENIGLERIDENTLRVILGPYQSRFTMIVTKNNGDFEANLITRDDAARAAIFHLMQEIREEGAIVKPAIPLEKIIWNSTTAQPCSGVGVCDVEIKEMRSPGADMIYRFHYDSSKPDPLSLPYVSFVLNGSLIDLSFSGVTWRPGEIYNWRQADVYAVEKAVNFLRGNGVTQYALYHDRKSYFSNMLDDGFIHEFELVSANTIHSFLIRKSNYSDYAIEPLPAGYDNPIVHTNNLQGRAVIALAKALNFSFMQQSDLHILTTNPDDNNSTADIELYGNIYHYKAKSPLPANVFDLVLYPPKQQAALDAIHHLLQKPWELSPLPPQDLIKRYRWSEIVPVGTSSTHFTLNLTELRGSGDPVPENSPKLIYHFDVTVPLCQINTFIPCDSRPENQASQLVTGITVDRQNGEAVRINFQNPSVFDAINVSPLEVAASDLLSRVNNLDDEIVLHAYTVIGRWGTFDGLLERFEVVFDVGEAFYNYKIKSRDNVSAVDPEIENNPMITPRAQGVVTKAQTYLAAQLGWTDTDDMNQITMESIETVISTDTDLTDYIVSFKTNDGINDHLFEIHVESLSDDCIDDAEHCRAWLIEKDQAVALAFRDFRIQRELPLSEIHIKAVWAELWPGTQNIRAYWVNFRDEKEDGALVYLYRIDKNRTTQVLETPVLTGVRVWDNNQTADITDDDISLDINFNGMTAAAANELDVSILEAAGRRLLAERPETAGQILKLFNYGFTSGDSIEPEYHWETFNFDLINEAPNGNIYGMEVSRRDQVIQSPEVIFSHENNDVGQSILELARLLGLPMRQRIDIAVVDRTQMDINFHKVNLRLYDSLYRFQSNALFPAEQQVAVDALTNLFARGVPIQNIQWDSTDGDDSDQVPDSLHRTDPNDTIDPDDTIDWNNYNLEISELRDGGKIVYHYVVNRSGWIGFSPANILEQIEILSLINQPALRYIRSWGEVSLSNDTTINSITKADGFHAIEAALDDLMGIDPIAGENIFLDAYSEPEGSEVVFNMTFDTGESLVSYEVELVNGDFTVIRGELIEAPGMRAARYGAAEIAARLGILGCSNPEAVGPDCPIFPESINRTSSNQWEIVLRFGENLFSMSATRNPDDSVEVNLAPGAQARIAALAHFKEMMEHLQIYGDAVDLSQMTAGPLAAETQRVDLSHDWDPDFNPATNNAVNVIYHYQMNTGTVDEISGVTFELTIEGEATRIVNVNFVEDQNTYVDWNGNTVEVNAYAVLSAVRRLDIDVDFTLMGYELTGISETPGGQIQTFHIELDNADETAHHSFDIQRGGDAYGVISAVSDEVSFVDRITDYAHISLAEYDALGDFVRQEFPNLTALTSYQIPSDIKEIFERVMEAGRLVDDAFFQSLTDPSTGIRRLVILPNSSSLIGFAMPGQRAIGITEALIQRYLNDYGMDLTLEILTQWMAHEGNHVLEFNPAAVPPIPAAQFEQMAVREANEIMALLDSHRVVSDPVTSKIPSWSHPAMLGISQFFADRIEDSLEDGGGGGIGGGNDGPNTRPYSGLFALLKIGENNPNTDAPFVPSDLFAPYSDGLATLVTSLNGDVQNVRYVSSTRFTIFDNLTYHIPFDRRAYAITWEISGTEREVIVDDLGTVYQISNFTGTIQQASQDTIPLFQEFYNINFPNLTTFVPVAPAKSMILAPDPEPGPVVVTPLPILESPIAFEIPDLSGLILNFGALSNLGNLNINTETIVGSITANTAPEVVVTAPANNTISSGGTTSGGSSSTFSLSGFSLYEPLKIQMPTAYPLVTSTVKTVSTTLATPLFEPLRIMPTSYPRYTAAPLVNLAPAASGGTSTNASLSLTELPKIRISLGDSNPISVEQPKTVTASTGTGMMLPRTIVPLTGTGSTASTAPIAVTDTRAASMTIFSTRTPTVTAFNSPATTTAKKKRIRFF